MKRLYHRLQTFAPETTTYCVVDQFCPVFVTKHCGEDSVDEAVKSLKKEKIVQLYPLLKEKRESGNRGLLLVMGFSSVSAHKKHLGSLFLLLLLYLIFWLCCAACGVPVPQLGLNQCPLHWKLRVSITGPPEKFPEKFVYNYISSCNSQKCQFSSLSWSLGFCRFIEYLR